MRSNIDTSLWLPSKYGKFDIEPPEESVQPGYKKLVEQKQQDVKERFEKIEKHIADRIDVQKLMYLNELRAKMRFAKQNGTEDDLLKTYEQRLNSLVVIDFKDL